MTTPAQRQASDTPRPRDIGYRRARERVTMQAVWRCAVAMLATTMLRTPPVQGAEAAQAGASPPPRLHPIGPPLLDLSRKIDDPRWLVAWLVNPAALRPHSLMRNFNLSDAEARALAASLYRSTPVRRSDVQRPQSTVGTTRGDAEAGRDLFVSRGCRGCHTVGAAPGATATLGPDLGGIGIKVRGEWLAEWLRSPRSYDPYTPMPQLVLSDDEIRQLVAYLQAQRQGAERLAAVAAGSLREDPELARATLVRFDCAKCHLVPGVQTIEPLTDMGALPRGCTACHEPGGSAPRAPRASSADETTQAVLQNGQLLIEHYRCRGCHRIDGQEGQIAGHLERKTLAPPVLDGAGARLQTSWLIDFLQRPRALRPWLGIRMPDYGLSAAEARALAEYFAARAGIAAVDEPLGGEVPDVARHGRRRFAHFKCAQCHPQAGAPVPVGLDLDDLAIDLTFAASRLRPAWLRAFLARPKALVGAQTRMPAVFYNSDGIPAVEHPEHDIEAVSAYVLHMAVVDAAPAAGDATIPPEAPAVDWTTVPY